MNSIYLEKIASWGKEAGFVRSFSNIQNRTAQLARSELPFGSKKTSDILKKHVLANPQGEVAYAKGMQTAMRDTDSNARNRMGALMGDGRDTWAYKTRAL